MIQDQWFKLPDPLFYLEGPGKPLVPIQGRAVERGHLSNTKWPFGYEFILTEHGELFYRADFFPNEWPGGWTETVKT